MVITRETQLEELIKKYNTKDQARFYITHLGEDFDLYERQHRTYYQALEEVMQALEKLGKIQRLDRSYLPNFIFGEEDIVVVVGQDGLVANTMKYLNRQSIIAVNPDKSFWDGVLLPFEAKDLKKIVPETIKGKRRVKEVTMAKASLQDGQVLYAVNDLFIGPKTHSSARYKLQFGERAERQSSSGIIVSTGLGSSGWLKSILCGAIGISSQVEAHSASVLEQNGFLMPNLTWDSRALIFSVREPFPSKHSQAGCVFGEIREDKPLLLTSQMPENGVIFSDGVESDFLVFSSGMQAEIAIAERRGHLVV